MAPTTPTRLRNGLAALALLVLATSVTAAHAATREYWIVAEETEWDYAPSFPTNLLSGQPFTGDQRVFVGDGEARIGRVYTKAVFHEYAENFTARLPRGEAESHLGILGPVIRAEVGDTLLVHFRNDTRFPASLHPHGVLYQKDAEGAMYMDGTSGGDKADDSVAPGKTFVYQWEVPERAGPGPRDASSVAWPYHSHVDSPRAVNSGMIGVIIVTARGQARPDGSPVDVDREFVTLFNVFDENQSLYLEHNIQARAPGIEDPESDDFVESNLMHAMNGFLWGNNVGYEMRVGERVRWHVFGMGTEVDIHTPHWHGATLLWSGMRVDATEVFPATVRTLDLVPDVPGKWMYHCHVNDHIDAGMMTTFTVLPAAP